MIGVLGDKETVIGFRMAGVKDCLETNEKNLKQNLERIKDKKIIIISERLYKLIEVSKNHIFVPIPDKYGSLKIDTVKGLIKEIIGKEFD
ncbi:MAG: V-type ATP synthase subunit F [Candidatus Aenigmarchaeota archaeon]|nr:V-type ATP synthase subunit F [Candidatus Aenigmarchaeota archaeon]NIP39970.1 V-type ATP synthase subunit F [Candidatus Aenigmarchaeota archaeon]NIQ17689.1 V-type ATP synthase subunit F [Candidatus Aenigmarchaeota archaeon]NIS72877.1 V-type ATP synthase subunit F [Candidatus Aenigmarchaeota archaeon]